MVEQTPRTLNHFALFSFKDPYFHSDRPARKAFHSEWLSSLRRVTRQVGIYQVYPAQGETDLLVWCSLEAEQQVAAARFFTQFTQATNPHRRLIELRQSLWGFTRPSQYTKSRSNQEIDPFDTQHKTYLVVYPFFKKTEWYLMSREARQGMMNQHIRIGKQYPSICQLLLYSFGLQDQEFIVIYETDDLVQFSDLVYELRDSDARRFTLRDTPVFTAIYHPAEETLALWE